MAEDDLTPSEREVADALRSLAHVDVTWTDPPPGLWSRIETALQEIPESAGHVTSLEFGRSGSSKRRQGSVSRRTLLAVAAGGLIAGVGLGALGWQVAGSRGGEVLARADLTPLDAPDILGTAQVRRTSAGVELRVTATTPFRVPAGYIEVWLINLDGRRMVSVGVYGGQPEESFPITDELLGQGYVVVDLSRERFDDQPTHSGDSLVRGRLEP